MPAAGEHHPAFEEYCECIFELKEDRVKVVQARIAERLQVSRPAVSEMIRRLEAEHLLTIDGGLITLTPAGNELAQRVVRRHRLAERFLTDMLGLSWADAHHEAGKWEHVMSDAVESAMDRVLGSPTTCPHGNPIPGSEYLAPASTPLQGLAVVAAATVLLSSGCAATTFDTEVADDVEQEAAATTTTALPTGPAEELLPELVATAAQVSQLMVADEDARGTAERVAALWDAASQEVAASRPELLGNFDANVARIATSVRYRRAADADKATANLRALVDAFLT
jgi:DtxR family Mn-dependent transcriptional regulator